MVDKSELDEGSFENLIRENFGFLEGEAHMKFLGVRSIGGNDPRDAGLVARYSRNSLRVDVGWSKFVSSLTVSLKFEADEIPRKLRHLYFEPFIEFLTDGREKAIVPYMLEGMSIKEILSLSVKREEVFKAGLPVVAKAVGEKLRLYFNQVESVTFEQIGQFNEWVATKRKG